MNDSENCGADADIHDCIAQLVNRDSTSQEGKIYGLALRLFLRDHWRPWVQRFNDHVADEATYRNQQDAKNDHRDEVMKEIRDILLDPDRGMLRQHNDDMAAKAQLRRTVAITVGVVSVCGAFLTMLWHLLQIAEKLSAVVGRLP